MAKRRREGAGAGLRRTMLLVRELLSGAPVTAARAAKILCVEEPAAREQLKALGGIEGVSVEKVGRAQRWVFTAPPGTASVPSVIATCFGASLAPLLEPSAYGGYLQGVRSKVIGLSKKEERFRNIERKFWFVSQGGATGENDGLLDDLLDALLDENSVVLTYVNFAGEEKTAKFEPFSIVVYQHQLYLVARHEDGTIRPLRLSRIRGLESGVPFKYPNRTEFDPSLLFKDSFGVWLSNEPTTEIVLRLEKSWETHARTHQWHSSQNVESSAADITITLKCRLCPELEQWILSFGEAAEVLKPVALRQRIAQRIVIMNRRYARTE